MPEIVLHTVLTAMFSQYPKAPYEYNCPHFVDKEIETQKVP